MIAENKMEDDVNMDTKMNRKWSNQLFIKRMSWVKGIVLGAVLWLMLGQVMAQTTVQPLQALGDRISEQAAELASISPERSARLQPFFFDHEKELARKYFIKGLGFYNAKSYSVAIRYFFAALQKRTNDNDKTLKRNTIRYFLGLAYFKAGYLEEGAQQWANIESLADETRFADMNDLAQKRNLLARLGNYEQPLQWAGERPRLGAISVFANRFYETAATLEIVYQQTRSFPETDSDATKSIFDFKKGYELVTPIALSSSPVHDSLMYVMDISTYKILTVDPLGVRMGKHSPFSVPFVYYPLKRPYDFNISEAGELWVTDLGHNQVVHLSATGKVLRKLGGKGIADGEFLNPKGVAMGPNGTIWVADSGNARLQVFSDTGEWIRTLGTKGTGNGEYLYPTRIVYESTRERFYVLDSLNKRIQVLDAVGNPLYVWGSKQLVEPLDLKVVPGHPDILLVLDGQALFLGDSERRIWKTVQLMGMQEVPPSAFNTASLSTLLANDVRPQQIGAGTTFKNRYLAVNIDKAGTLYLANGTTGKIDVFKPYGLNMANAHVEVEHVKVSDFPQIRVEVRVRNAQGVSVDGLLKDNFLIEEEGVAQVFSVRSLRENNFPLRTTLLMEVTEDMRGKTLMARTFLAELMKELGPRDRVLPIFYGNVGDVKKGTLLGKNYLDATFNAGADVRLLGGGKFFGPELRRVLSEQLLTTLTALAARSSLKPNLDENSVSGIFSTTTPTGKSGAAAPTHPQRGFPQALQLGIEKLLPYHGERAIILLALTPHALGAWSDKTSRGGVRYARLLNFASANNVPVYVVYGGNEALTSKALTPLRTFAESTGGRLFSYEETTARGVLTDIHAFQTGRYVLQYRSHKRPLGQDLFFPVNVRVQLGTTSGQDSWNGFIHP